MLQATNNSSNFETTVTITGLGGFGKTTAVISLCHNPLVKEHFTDGFVFVELGPQATDPSKLFQLYHLFTGEHLKYHDISLVEQEIKQLTNTFYRNLLIIIDDVWYVEDAIPFVKAFTNCKTILTTRMNDIEQYIPSIQSVTVGPVTQNEAISLLTSGVIDSSQLSQEDVSLLDELAQNVHLWPLLLSLIRGQLFYNLKQCHLSYQCAIENIQAKLHHKGLTAFDKNNLKDMKDMSKSRNLAVKACIEITLELLTNSMSDNFKSLTIWSGIGYPLQTAVLHTLWDISKEQAQDVLDTLWNYGLVQFSYTSVSSTSITQHCVEVHAVISQYIFDSITTEEAYNLTNIVSATFIHDEMGLVSKQSFGVVDEFSLSHVDHLKYVINQIENAVLPYFLKSFSWSTVSDPHTVVHILQHTIKCMPALQVEFTKLLDDCKRIVKEAPYLCRKFNRTVQRNFFEKDYDKLIQTVENYNKNYPLCNVVQQAITKLSTFTPKCTGKLHRELQEIIKYLQLHTCDNHLLATLSLPFIKFHIKVHKEITNALENDTSDIERCYHYMTSGKFLDDYDLIRINHLIKNDSIIPGIHRSAHSYVRGL